MKTYRDQWFIDRNWKQFKFQKECWNHIHNGKSGMLQAPTGSGKTLALWAGIAEEFQKRSAKNKKELKGLHVLWITPLRALAKEIGLAAEEYVKGMKVPISIGVRTGDTSSSERARQAKQLPNLLITTPESLQLLLAQKKYPSKLSRLQFLVVDEWHDLIGTKRGVQMELGISRLKGLNHKLQCWGISATIGNMKEAENVLFGEMFSAEERVFVQANIKKKLEVKTLIPRKMENYPWHGHLGLKMAASAMRIIRKSTSTLLFTNTRGQSEAWYHHLIDAYPELLGVAAIHHGSIDKKVRLWIEEQLRIGKLKLVVCTSSLDLGVDFSPVETVIQVGSPKGVARFVQRAGRSGHQPGKTSRIYFLPTNAWELLESEALQHAVKDGVIESRIPYVMCFDVLVQYLVTLAVSEGFYPEDVYEELTRTHAYKSLSLDEYGWCLDFITRGGQGLEAYDDFKRVVIEEGGLLKVHSRSVAMRHRLSIGTIVGDPIMKVKFQKGKYLGTIEERFISQLKEGEHFWFAGRSLQFVRVQNMDALVVKGSNKKGKIPAWVGGRIPLSSQLSEYLLKRMTALDESVPSTPEQHALQAIREEQNRESKIPKSTELLMEYVQTNEGYHLFVFPFQGRMVHESMCSLVAYRLSQKKRQSFSLAFNDYGFEILSDQQMDLEPIQSKAVFSSENLHNDLQAGINSTEMARRKFRDIAVISGLVFQGYPNKGITQRFLQSSSGLFFNVFEDYDAENLLLRQSFDETFQFQLEELRLRQVLKEIEEKKVVLFKPSTPTPLSFPILVDRLREQISSEKLEDRIAKMTVAFRK
jgi:ATP-dependent Lhr-like helicase